VEKDVEFTNLVVEKTYEVLFDECLKLGFDERQVKNALTKTRQEFMAVLDEYADAYKTKIDELIQELGVTEDADIAREVFAHHALIVTIVAHTLDELGAYDRETAFKVCMRILDEIAEGV